MTTKQNNSHSPVLPRYLGFFVQHRSPRHRIQDKNSRLILITCFHTVYRRLLVFGFTVLQPQSSSFTCSRTLAQCWAYIGDALPGINQSRRGWHSQVFAFHLVLLIPADHNDLLPDRRCRGFSTWSSSALSPTEPLASSSPPFPPLSLLPSPRGITLLDECHHHSTKSDL